MEINFMTQIWQEGEMYVAYAPELDISSCGKTSLEARENLHEAVEITKNFSKVGFYSTVGKG